MGPPPFGDGKADQPSNFGKLILASMGPPPFGDGKGRWPPSPTSSASRFNGATAFRRWKVHECGGSWPRLARFNGATAFRRWKGRGAGAHRKHHRLASMGPPPFGDGKSNCGRATAAMSCGFNGATAFRRWKGHWRARWNAKTVPASMGPPPFGDGKGHVPARLQRRGHASMGPPPFGDGKQRGDGKTDRGIHSFNGATAFRRWKARGQFALFEFRSHVLQWGHRLSAMERGIRRFRTSSSTGLQWGHRLSAMERPRLMALLGSVISSLQWGHRLSAMESGIQHDRRGVLRDASMGPPPFGDGKDPAGGRGAWDRSCFNGATAFRRWKASSHQATKYQSNELQWGHRLSAMESVQPPVCQPPE